MNAITVLYCTKCRDKERHAGSVRSTCLCVLVDHNTPTRQEITKLSPPPPLSSTPHVGSVDWNHLLTNCCGTFPFWIYFYFNFKKNFLNCSVQMQDSTPKWTLDGHLEVLECVAGCYAFQGAFNARKLSRRNFIVYAGRKASQTGRVMRIISIAA